MEKNRTGENMLEWTLGIIIALLGFSVAAIYIIIPIAIGVLIIYVLWQAALWLKRQDQLKRLPNALSTKRPEQD